MNLTFLTKLNTLTIGYRFKGNSLHLLPNLTTLVLEEPGNFEEENLRGLTNLVSLYSDHCYEFSDECFKGASKLNTMIILEMKALTR